MNRRVLPAALLSAAVVVAACAASERGQSSALSRAARPSDDRGRLVGAIVFSGGPAPGVSDRRQGGRVRVLHHGRVVAAAQVQEGHGFAFRLRPRHYQLVTKSGDAQCPKKGVRVRRGAVTRVRVTCDVR
ncbi:MAG: hypothetical protein ACJ760_14275 [Thermoleophilaceae bacterium]